MSARDAKIAIKNTFHQSSTFNDVNKDSEVGTDRTEAELYQRYCPYIPGISPKERDLSREQEVKNIMRNCASHFSDAKGMMVYRDPLNTVTNEGSRIKTETFGRGAGQDLAIAKAKALPALPPTSAPPGAPPTPKPKPTPKAKPLSDGTKKKLEKSYGLLLQSIADASDIKRELETEGREGLRSNVPLLFLTALESHSQAASDCCNEVQLEMAANNMPKPGEFCKRISNHLSQLQGQVLKINLILDEARPMLGLEPLPEEEEEEEDEKEVPSGAVGATTSQAEASSSD